MSNPEKEVSPVGPSFILTFLIKGNDLDLTIPTGYGHKNIPYRMDWGDGEG